MTAHRVVTLTCDKPGCRERYVGGEARNPSRVRTEASKLSGWTSPLMATDQSTIRRDLCRWHS